MGSTSMAVRLSLLLLCVSLSWISNVEARGRGRSGRGRVHGRTDQDVINTRKRLLSLIDPRKGSSYTSKQNTIDPKEDEKPKTITETTTTTTSAPSYVPQSTPLWTTPRPIVTVISTTTTKAPRKTLRRHQNRGLSRKIEADVNARLDTGKSDQEFVTKLNKVMNLSYMNSGVFRGGRKNREKNHENNVLSVVQRKFNSRKIDYDNGNERKKDFYVSKERTQSPEKVSVASVPSSSYSYQTNFDYFTPKLNELMNLSYMNSQSFRDAKFISGFPNNDFKRLKSENKVVIKRRRIPATHGELPRRVFVTDTNTKLHNNQLLEADRSINVLNSKTVHQISSPPDSSKFNWMWPPNSMKFHNFNFEAFDAQFQRKPNKIPTFLRLDIPINRGGNQFSESASYSLSIIL